MGAATQEFVERTWLLDEGLPHNVVLRAIQDQRGFLWVTTAHGLTRFDGRDFKDYSPTFPHDFRQGVRDIGMASDGSLILLPAAGGVSVLKNGVTTRHPASEALSSQPLFSVFVEPGGALWLGGGALYRWHRGRLESFGPDQGFQRKFGARYSFACDEQGEVWIAMGSELLRYKDGDLVIQPGNFGSKVTIAPSVSGGVWIFGEDRLFHANDSAIQLISALPELKQIGEAMALIEDKNGALWIASRNHGLFRFSDGQLQNISISHQRLSSIMQDAEGNIWVSSNGGGLLRISPRAFISLPAETGAPPEATTSIAETSDGTLWLANRASSLARWKNNQMQVVTLPAFFQKKFFIVCADQAGRIWVSAGEGLYRFPVSHPEKIERVEEITGPVFALHCADNGDLWVCSDQKKTGFFRDDRYHPIIPSDGAPDGPISAFAENGSGRLWLATQEGALYEHIEGRLIRDSAYTEQFNHRIHALHSDRDGSLWVGTRVGLVRKRGSEYKLINAASGLPDDLIIQILEDDARRLWIGSRRGIYGVSLDELNAVADGRKTRLGSLTLGRNEGLVGAYSFVSGPPTAMRSRSGILWFTTHRGVVGIDPSVQLPGAKPPLVYIDEVLIADKHHRIVEGQPLVIPPNSSTIEFRFSAINFSAPEKVRIRHRLSGLEADWKETSTQRSATYAQLPPGSYELSVIACNQSGAWSEKPVRLQVIVKPSWWQSGWIKSVALILFTGAVFFGARHWSYRRLQTRLKRFEHAHALELERARIARDLHDELGGSITQIGLLAERVKRQSVHPEMEQSLSALASRTRSIATELESIVWTLSPKNTTWSALTTFISSFASRFFRDAEMSCTIENIGRAPDLLVPPDVQHHVLAIAKEAMNNVCKHAGASLIVVSLGIESESFFLRMKDDGVGFDPGAQEHSERNGLSNMRARAREIGASLSIASRPGIGAELILHVPLHAIVTTRTVMHR